MPVLQKAIQVAGKPLPKFISPKAHAIIDYTTATIFLVGAAAAFRKNKRAAVAALICGVAEAVVGALTDYPGGLVHAISFPLHRKIDLGMSSMVAMMPEFLAFADEKEKSFFRVQSLLIAGSTTLTNFEPQRIYGERERRAA